MPLSDLVVRMPAVQRFGISLFFNFWYGINDWFSPECSSGTGSIDLGCWSSWESHKVLSYERRNGTSQGAH